MNDQTSPAGKAAAAAPARGAATKANATENKADTAKNNKARTLTGEDAETVPDGPSAVDRAGAGSFPGKFTARRELIGDQNYASGDPRSAVVSEVIHLVQSGALAPADKATAEACKTFGDVDAEVVKPKSEVKKED
mgnify:CR=1 FL=1